MAVVSVHVTTKVDVDRFKDSLRRAVEQIEQMKPGMDRLLRAIRVQHESLAKPSRRVRPRPLCIDGHAYARRRRSRTRR